jgi:general nucleoside transport system permease protein
MGKKITIDKAKIKIHLKRLQKDYQPTIIAVALGFFIGGLVILFSGFNPFRAILTLLRGGFGSTYAITTTLTRAIPITFAGIAAALAWGSGYPSLGAAGQMTLGAITTAVVAIIFPGPPIVALFFAIIAGMLAGVLYSLISAYISDRFKLNLLIATLMMNYIANNIASYLTQYVFRDPFSVDSSAIQTERIQGAILPIILKGYTLHYGFIILIFTIIIIWFIKSRTSFGYRAKMGGLNKYFAQYGGIKSRMMMLLVLSLSGAIAGLGGAIQVLGTRYRYVDGMISSPGFAWSGVIASLMANNHPIGIFFSSIFLAGLATGGGAMERSVGVPSEVTAIIQSIITLFITARFAIQWRRKMIAKEVQMKGANL